MKSLTILALLFCNQLHGQVSVSLGVDRWSEINLQNHFFTPFDNTLRYSHLKKYLGVSYQNQKHLFSSEFNHFRKTSIPIVTSQLSISGGGSSPLQSYSKVYRSQLNYSYVGFKLGYAYTFEGTSLFCDKWQSMIELGGYIGFDFLRSYSEQYHYTRETASNNSNSSQTMTVIFDEMSSEEFKAVAMRERPIYAGIYLARRLTIGGVFIRGAISYGKLNHGSSGNMRVKPLNCSYKEGGSLIAPEPERQHFLSTDISIGYTFQKKNNYDINRYPTPRIDKK